MGLFTGLIGLAYLKQRQLDLEYKIQSKMMESTQNATFAMELITIGDDLKPDSAEFKRLETEREKLQLVEKRIQAEILRYQNQLKIVNGQIEVAQKFVDDSIRRLTSFGGSGRGIG